jgi:hypothetical protein
MLRPKKESATVQCSAFNPTPVQRSDERHQDLEAPSPCLHDRAVLCTTALVAALDALVAGWH